MKYLIFLLTVACINKSFAYEKAFQLQIGTNKLTLTLINTGELPLTNLSIQLTDNENSDGLILSNHFLTKLAVGEQINVPLEIFLTKIPKWQNKIIQLNIPDFLQLVR